jgi:tetratricopeptide (TPR) repeat protein
MSGSTPPSGVAKAVFRETEGNPFFVEEVYQHLSEEGRLFDATGAWRTDLRVDTIEVPEGVRLVIGRRLQRLGEQARKVLTAAAVIGRVFPLDLLCAVVDATEDQVLDAVDEADHAQLVQADANQRTPRYGFVHELIRSTLVGDLSLPRRQRLHLRIADAIERLRASSLDSQASVLAHHLYQAGAAVDAQRTAKALTLAGTRALEAGAFEEALTTFDNLLSLELDDSDPVVALSLDKRGYARLGLRRLDDACADFDRSLTISSDLHDDAGILRAGADLGGAYAWRGRFPEAVAVYRRALAALSAQARDGRAQLLAWIAAGIVSPGHIEEATQHADEALAIAATIDDPDLMRRVLVAIGGFQRMRGEFEPSSDTLRHALTLTPPNAVWDRTDLLAQLVVSEYYLGHFAVCDGLCADLKTLASRAGHGGGQYLQEWIQAWIRLARDGDLRAFRAHALAWLDNPHFRYLTHIAIGQGQLYLGEVGPALDTLGAVVGELPDSYFTGMPQGSLFAAAALAGQHDRARALAEDVIAWLPTAGRPTIMGACYALDTFVTGLAHLGERDQRGALYPLTLDYIRTGQVVAGLCIGPTNAELAAALSADAAGLVDQARVHFERALQQSRDLPLRLLEPTVEYWYGRAFAESPDNPDQPRGRAMVEAALEKFRRYEMVLHTDLAERFLRTEAR